MPPYRRLLYQQFRACERFGIVPPGIEAEWDENVPWQQALLMAYDSIREKEELDRQAELFKAMIPMRMR